MAATNRVVVHNLRTGSEVAQYVGLSAEEAVVAAYAQHERRDHATWQYRERYQHLVTRGRVSVSCGDYAALARDRTEDCVTAVA